MKNDIIKTEGLEISDKVLYNNSRPVTIESVHSSYSINVEEGNTIFSVYLLTDSIKPIELTSHILEANKFEKVEDNIYKLHIGNDFGTTIRIYLEEGGVSIDKYNSEEELFERLLWIRHIHTVHQLQHALRLCELTDLANNIII